MNSQDRTEISALNREVGELSVKVSTLETTQGKVLEELKAIRSEISFAKSMLRGAKVAGVFLLGIVGLNINDVVMFFRS